MVETLDASTSDLHRVEADPGTGYEFSLAPTTPEDPSVLLDARQGLVQFLGARITAPATLFQNQVAVMEARQREYDAQPFDFETGEFKSDAAEAFRINIAQIITIMVDGGTYSGIYLEGYSRRLQRVYEYAVEKVDDLVDEVSHQQFIDLDDLENRWLDDNTIGQYMSIENLLQDPRL